jgi:hypothetical protein
MPNATVRANARTMPKPAPAEPPFGSVESIRQQTDENIRDVALLKPVQSTVHEPVESDDYFVAISRAYARWLKARAAIKADFPEDEKAVSALFDDERAAARELFSLPAVYSEDVWHKVEVFEIELMDEQVVGQPTNSVLLLGLGSIKTDLLRLGIGDGRAQ